MCCQCHQQCPTHREELLRGLQLVINASPLSVNTSIGGEKEMQGIDLWRYAKQRLNFWKFTSLEASLVETTTKSLTRVKCRAKTLLIFVFYTVLLNCRHPPSWLENLAFVSNWSNIPALFSFCSLRIREGTLEFAEFVQEDLKIFAQAEKTFVNFWIWGKDWKLC